MPVVIGVRFKKAGKVYYFDPAGETIVAGDNVIVETARGVEFGHVVIAPREIEEKDIIQPLKKVTRKADQNDLAKVEENLKKAEDAFKICEEKINEHKMDMKLIDVEITFDNGKIIFFFTAEGRVDFRDLVKDLASVFKTRIELRQIGVRDEAKMLGGIASCGRVLCCHSFLGDFHPVSIKMAKEQNLSLNPAKISGICGRLMCCLKYENDVYKMYGKELRSKYKAPLTDIPEMPEVVFKKKQAEPEQVESESEKKEIKPKISEIKENISREKEAPKPESKTTETNPSEGAKPKGKFRYKKKPKKRTNFSDPK